MDPKDHDILIRVDTKVDGILEDMRIFRKTHHEEAAAIRADASALSMRISSMELNKVSVAEYVSNKKDHDAQIKQLQRAYWISIGVVTALQFVAPVIVSKLFP